MTFAKEVRQEAARLLKRAGASLGCEVADLPLELQRKFYREAIKRARRRLARARADRRRKRPPKGKVFVN